MPLIDKDDHRGAATVDELLHDLVQDAIHTIPAGATTTFCRPPDRLHRPRRVRREGSPHRFCRCEVAPIREAVPPGRSRAGAMKIHVNHTDNTLGAAA